MRHLVPACALALPLVVPPLGEELVHGAEEDTEVVRTYSWVTELELDGMTMTFNGDELPEELLPQMEMAMVRDETYVVRDVYGAPGDGRPERLVRTFETLEGVDETSGTGFEGEDLGEELELTSELEGRTVEFTWDEDEEEYVVAFADDGDGDEDLLEDLREDMDLRGFLPDEEVEEGDSWSVDIEVFDRLAAGLEVLADEERGEEADACEDQLDENREGQVEATFTGVRDEDGVRVAVIFVTAELETWGEETEELDGAELESSMTFGTELEGEMLWNLDAGHLFSLELAGLVSMTQSMSGEDEVEGESFEFGQEMEFSGEMTISIHVETE